MHARRFLPVVVAASAALALGLTLPGSATAATAASGSAVITESSTFFQQAAAQGVFAAPLPSATGAYSSANGLTSTFPVTGGTGNVDQITADLQLGGGLLIVDVKTGRAAAFTNLDFNTFLGQFTGVPVGGSTPVALLDPAGDLSVGGDGTAQTLTSSELDVDPAGAAYLNAHLQTGFFAGQSVGSFAVSYTPAS
ncbi:MULTISPECIES: hypothetical protein [Streptacidiphilus]|uniref:CHRD domain-containing protein n=2 Tax=Streptacidiphilus TaxID=228398 RepID=A0ABV6USI1_9ACTN|nr:hypothetical protein [Streptacidiphilus jeojiense]